MRARLQSEWCTALGILETLRGFLQLESCTLLVFFVWPLFWSPKKAGLETTGRAPAASVVRRFEERYRGASRLQVTFLERYTENGRLVRMEAGKAYFLRPGKMRWEYESPEKNIFVVDGKTAWFYVPADHTVTRVPAKKSSDWHTPLAVLAGEMKLSRICSRVGYAEQFAPEHPADVMLYCDLPTATKSKEKDDPGRRAGSGEAQNIAYLEIAEDSGELVRVQVNDPGGVGIEFRFANWQWNPRVEDSLFRFQVPPGVAIVNGEVAPAQKTAIP